MRTRILFLAAAGLAIALLTAQAQPARSFMVDFSQCTEFAGVGPVNYEKATGLVPAVFSALSVGTTGALVVRATACSGVSINGGRSVPTSISQIGVEIVSPDGTGDINNYTLIYASNNPELVLAFNSVGVPAIYDPSLTYQFTYDSTGKAGELYAEVAGIGLPAYFLTGTETDPTAPGSDFKANWWFAKGGETVKEASDFPNIAFGSAAVSLHTDRNSVLGQLIGGNTDSDFHFLPIRGVYASAHMLVTTATK